MFIGLWIMLNRSFIRFTNRVDIYSQTYLTNDMGQKVSSWNLTKEAMKCLYVSARSSTGIRITPNQIEANYFLFYFNYDAPIDYGLRLKNVTNSLRSEVIEDSWLQIIQIDKELSYSGKVQYLSIRAKSVIE